MGILRDLKHYVIKGHKAKRKSCKKCTSMHTKAEHRFHGKNSYKKTHGKKGKR